MPHSASVRRIRRAVPHAAQRQCGERFVEQEKAGPTPEREPGTPRCCWPPESCRGRWRATPTRSKWFNISRTRRSRSPWSSHHQCTFDGEMRKHRVILKHEADATVVAADARQRPCRASNHVSAANSNSTSSGFSVRRGSGGAVVLPQPDGPKSTVTEGPFAGRPVSPRMIAPPGNRFVKRRSPLGHTWMNCRSRS